MDVHVPPEGFEIGVRLPDPMLGLSIANKSMLQSLSYDELKTEMEKMKFDYDTIRLLSIDEVEARIPKFVKISKANKDLQKELIQQQLRLRQPLALARQPALLNRQPQADLLLNLLLLLGFFMLLMY